MIIVSAISSFPRKRESISLLLDSRFCGNDVYAVAEFMIKAFLPFPEGGLGRLFLVTPDGAGVRTEAFEKTGLPFPHTSTSVFRIRLQV